MVAKVRHAGYMPFCKLAAAQNLAKAMNPIAPKVYSTAMRTVFTLCALVCGTALMAQMPWELERHPPEAYKLRPSPIDPADALDAWWTAWKVQRAKEPARYFPQPDAHRAAAKSALPATTPAADLAAIACAESQCTAATARALLATEPGSDYTLPWRFIAAYILGRTDAETEALRLMDERGMLSEVLRTWGRQAMRSAQGSTHAVTHGLQDLMAVRAAQLLDGVGKEIAVYNHFAAQCKGYKGLSPNGYYVQGAWVSPVMTKQHLESMSDQLYISGLGYRYGMPGTQPAGYAMLKAVEGWTWPEAIPSQLPADRGLLQSYHGLYQVLSRNTIDGIPPAFQRYLNQHGMP
jgi:hypothetical protein